MSTAISTTTNLVLVPGSFSTPTAYSKLIPLLSPSFPIHTISLPSVNSNTPATALDDAAHIHDVLKKLTDEGKEIMLAMHSYGGIPGTESVKGLTKADMMAAGKFGGVIGLIYIAAFMIPPGATLASTTGANEMPDWVKIDGEFMRLDPKGGGRETFSDLSPLEAEAWGGKFEKHSMASFASKLTYPAYRDVPTTYILAEEDRIVPPVLQERMIDEARDGGAVVKVERLGSGHVPMVSMPEMVAAIVRAVAGHA